MAADPAIPVLRTLLTDGCARVPEAWGLVGPEQAGLWWRDEASSSPHHRSCARRYRSPSRGKPSPRCSRRTHATAKPGSICSLPGSQTSVGVARLPICSQESSDLDWQPGAPASAGEGATRTDSVHDPWSSRRSGVPADQPAAVPALLRVIGATASFVEAGQVNRRHPCCRCMTLTLHGTGCRVDSSSHLMSVRPAVMASYCPARPRRSARCECALSSRHPGSHSWRCWCSPQRPAAAERHGGVVLPDERQSYDGWCSHTSSYESRNRPRRSGGCSRK